MLPQHLKRAALTPGTSHMRWPEEPSPCKHRRLKAAPTIGSWEYRPVLVSPDCCVHWSCMEVTGNDTRQRCREDCANITKPPSHCLLILLVLFCIP